MQRSIPATPAVVQKLTQRIWAAREAKLAAEHAKSVVVDLFMVFCEDHGVPGANLVAIKDGHVIVALAESEGGGT
jgi:hypothetical protein